MSASQGTDPPSYPARVVRHLAERKHAVTAGVSDESGYQAELHRVLRRVTSDPARGLATKILTLRAVLEAGLCDAGTAGEYKNTCFARRVARDGSKDDVCVGTATLPPGEQCSVTAQPVSEKSTSDVFEEMRWHKQPGADPWAFSLDEDTAVLKELRFLTKKSREMTARAARAMEAQAQHSDDVFGPFCIGKQSWRSFGKHAERVVELGKVSEKYILEAEKEKDATKESCGKQPDEHVLRREELTQHESTPPVSSSRASLLRANAAVRDVTNFAKALETRYPWPKLFGATDRDGDETSTEATEIGFEFGTGVNDASKTRAIANWDDDDPADPDNLTSVSVHWSDIGMRGTGFGMRDTRTDMDVRNTKRNETNETTKRDDESENGEVVAGETARIETAGDATPPAAPIPTPTKHEKEKEAPTEAEAPNDDVPLSEPVVDESSLVASLVNDCVENVLPREKEKQREPPVDPVASLVHRAVENAIAMNAPTPRKPRSRALLVGCNYYNPVCRELTRLRGALNDVAAVAAALQSVGFEDDDVKILIDTPQEGRSSFFGRSLTSPVSPGKGKGNQSWRDGSGLPPHFASLLGITNTPTTENIKKQLKWLTNEAVAGDVLLFHFSGHATQVPDETDGELDGAYESLCSIDTDWAGNSGITEVDLIALSNRVTEIGAQLMVTIDAKHCGALGGSVVYVTDHAFVQSARAQIASRPGQVKKSQIHDTMFGRFVPPPTAAAARIEGLAREAKKNLLKQKNGEDAKNDDSKAGPFLSEASNTDSGVVVFTACHAKKGETCRETKCADGGIRGAFSDAFCEVLRASFSGTEKHEKNENGIDPSAFATLIGDAMRSGLEKEYKVDEIGGRQQTPVAVVARGGKTEVRLFV